MSRLLSSLLVDRERARFLLSAVGQHWLAALGTESGDPLRLQHHLRKLLPASEAAALGEQLTLRARARSRLTSPWCEWLWTSETLEMAAHPTVSARRARRLAHFAETVVDGTVGAGVDLAACADCGLRAVGFEWVPVRALLAAYNLAGRADVLCADIRCPPLDLSRAALLLDPSRRTSAGRVFDPHRFEPPWDTCVDLARRAPLAVLKAPPGIPHKLLPDDVETEWVQVRRSLREAALWFGRGARPGLRRAVILESGEELDSNAESAPWSPRPLGTIVYDPEPAVTRAGLVAHLAARLGAWPIDSEAAYLSSNCVVKSPFARPFEVLECIEFSIERLRTLLRRRGWRLGEILRRHFPLEPEVLRHRIGVRHGQPVAALCTTVMGKRVVILARPLATPAEQEFG